MMESPEFLTFKYDDYHRKPIAENIISLIKSDMHDISPLIIDSGWGTGKTVFCKRLINLFNEPEHIENYRLTYINTFNSDLHDEPILVILASILSLFDESQRKEIISNIVPALKSELKELPLSLLPPQTMNTTEAPKGCPVQRMMDHYLEGRLNNYIDADKNMATMRDALIQLTANDPVVVFIDEMDRCKPSYAVKMLETIKFAFDIKNIHFILITHFEQLKSSVNALYGNAINAREYLDKFIGLQISLPNDIKTEFHERIRNSVTHWQQCTKSVANIYLLNNCLEYRTFIRELIYNNDLSLREVETFSQYLNLFQTLPSNPKPIEKATQKGYGLYYIMGIYLYCFERRITKDILNHNLDIQKIKSVLLPDRYQNSANRWITSVLISGLNCSKNAINPIEKNRGNIDELSLLFNTKANLELFEDLDFILRETVRKLQLESR